MNLFAVLLLDLSFLLLDDNLPRHHLATDDMDKVDASRQVAHVDGGRALHAEATHLGTLRVDDEDTGAAFVIIRGDGHLASCRIWGDAHLERFCIHIRQLRNLRQDVGVVAVGHQLTRDLQNRVAGIVTVGAAVLAAHAVGIVGVAWVDVGRVKFVEHVCLGHQPARG